MIFRSKKLSLVFMVSIALLEVPVLAMDKLGIKNNSWSNLNNNKKLYLAAAVTTIGVPLLCLGENRNDGYGNTIIGTNNSITGNGNTVIGIANNINGHGNIVIGIKNNILDCNGNTIINITAVSFLIGIGMALFYSSKCLLTF